MNRALSSTLLRDGVISHVVASMTSSWVLVMSGRKDPQSQVLSGDEVQEVPQVLDHMVAHVVVSSDYATWGRPANENVQEWFVYKLMNEPY